MSTIRFAALGVLMSLLGCTKIKIQEHQAFDRKRTVNLQQLRDRAIEVTTTKLAMEDGTKLDVRYFVPPEAKATVLFFGGNGFLMVTAHDLMEALLDSRLAIVMFDYRGYGQSGGSPSVAHLKSDALALHAFATETLNVPPQRLILHGHSMGTLAATWVATQRTVAGLILESPVTDIEDLLDRMTPWLLDLFVSFEVEPALAAERNDARLRAVDVPILIVVGEDDKITPVSMAKDLFDLAQDHASLTIIPEHGHNDLPGTAEYRDAIQQYVDRTMAASVPGS